MVHSEVYIDFAVYYRFAESNYLLQKCLWLGRYPNWDPVFIELTIDFKIYGGQGDVVLILKKSIYGQAEATRLWYEKLQNGLLERGFVMSKVDTCVFMSKTVIFFLFVDDCLFWESSQL